jgi:hypothetical protein
MDNGYMYIFFLLFSLLFNVPRFRAGKEILGDRRRDFFLLTTIMGNLKIRKELAVARVEICQLCRAPVVRCVR